MTLDPDHGFGLLSPEDQEKMELILTERSDGSYGAPALHGMLTASVVGPKPLPMDWILQTVLSPPESEAIGFDNFQRSAGWWRKPRNCFSGSAECSSKILRCSGFWFKCQN
jgi:hypothetical protein